MGNHFYLYQVVGEMKRYINTFSTESEIYNYISENPLFDGIYEVRKPLSSV